MSARVLLIDNYDSFTYNLVQAFAKQGAEVIVHRNDEISVDEARDIDFSHLVISPGPGNPDDAGVSLAMIDAFANDVPVFGVCLGHQCIVQHFGGDIVRAGRLMHGKTSMARHDEKSFFAELSNPLEVGRYHSLCADPGSLPAALEISAQTERGEIMGVRHRELPIEGVQFHPESVLTPEGDQLMAGFMSMSAEGGNNRG